MWFGLPGLKLIISKFWILFPLFQVPYDNAACACRMLLEEQPLRPTLHDQYPVLDGAEVGSGFSIKHSRSFPQSRQKYPSNGLAHLNSTCTRRKAPERAAAWFLCCFGIRNCFAVEELMSLKSSCASEAPGNISMEALWGWICRAQSFPLFGNAMTSRTGPGVCRGCSALHCLLCCVGCFWTRNPCWWALVVAVGRSPGNLCFSGGAR